MRLSLAPAVLAAIAIVTQLNSPVRGADVAVSVDATQVLRSVDDRMFGLNTAVWDGLFKDPQSLSLLQAIDIRALRFPGGSTSDTYDWQTNRSYQTGTRTLNNWSWTNSFDDFAQVALTLHAQVFITVNYGSGTAQQAADWVTYSNVTKGYGFKYWEIGNECYGSWEEDIHPNKWDPLTYATAAADYLAKMKAVDPTIKVGVVVQTGEDNVDASAPVHNVTNPRTGATHHGWTPVVLATLKSLGVTPDYAIYHRYPLSPGSETDAKLLSGISVSNTTWANDVADLRRQLNDYLGTAGPNVELVVTENNDVSSEPGKQSTSLVDGLFLADSFGQLLQTEFTGFVWWAFHNGPPKDANGNLLGNFSPSLYGWRTYGDYGVLSQTNDPHPTYYAMKLLSHFARPGDRVVKATSGNALLAAYAVKRANGSLALLVINKDPAATTNGNFTVAGFAPGGTATVYSYGIPQDDAARTGIGSHDLASTTMSGLAATFQATFAPYSATVILVDPATPSAPTQATAFASGATEVTLTWQPPTTNAAGISGYKIERATDAAFTQGLSTFAAGSSTSYFDDTVAANTLYYYRISAVNAAGTSVPSAAMQVTTLGSDATGSARIVDIATRAYAGTGDNVTIGGFVVSGTKQVLLRAVGPSLSAQGLDPTVLLADPTMEVHHTTAVIGTNNDWGTNANAADIPVVAASLGAAPLLGTDTRSSALLTTLSSGVYSFVVQGNNGGTGIVLLEAYDAGGGDGVFVNIATRANAGTGDQVAIGGFVISGSGVKRVLIRAVGPTLMTQGIGASEVLQDPVIELHDARRGNVVIATNDNWGDNGNAAAIVTTGARIGATPFAGTDTSSAALLVRLPAGVYSFIAQGKAGTTGIVLVEVYDAD